MASMVTAVGCCGGRHAATVEAAAVVAAAAAAVAEMAAAEMAAHSCHKQRNHSFAC
jgi:RNase adaptor protein for sRNA GlmZ degradation